MELDVRASQDGQVHTIHVGASTLDAELVDYLAIALDDVERGPCSNLVIVFEGGATTTVGDFPALGADGATFRKTAQQQST